MLGQVDIGYQETVTVSAPAAPYSFSSFEWLTASGPTSYPTSYGGSFLLEGRNPAWAPELGMPAVPWWEKLLKFIAQILGGGTGSPVPSGQTSTTRLTKQTPGTAQCAMFEKASAGGCEPDYGLLLALAGAGIVGVMVLK